MQQEMLPASFQICTAYKQTPKFGFVFKTCTAHNPFTRTHTFPLTQKSFYDILWVKFSKFVSLQKTRILTSLSNNKCMVVHPLPRTHLTLKQLFKTRDLSWHLKQILWGKYFCKRKHKNEIQAKGLAKRKGGKAILLRLKGLGKFVQWRPNGNGKTLKICIHASYLCMYVVCVCVWLWIVGLLAGFACFGGSWPSTYNCTQISWRWMNDEWKVLCC